MRQDSGIGVLDKAVGVLHSIAESPCGLAELCDRTGLPRATASAGGGLEAHRLLARDGDGRWLLRPALTELAAHVHDPLLAASAVLPGCARSPARVQLYRREGTTRVCIAALEPAAGLRDTVPVGTRLPMTAGSAPRCCWRSATTQPRRRCCPRRSSPNGPWPRCVAAGPGAAEQEPGVASVSAPVRDRSGAVIAAVSVSDRSTGWAGAREPAGRPTCSPPPRR
jgi:DNA-binding IclR family transcriptional regulator